MDQRVGAYEILGELGRGAAGVVFEARDPAGRRVALKRTLTTHKDQWARAVREGEALAKLDHPNVVRVFGAGSDEQGPYLALELVEGRSLEERLEREGPLSPEAARALGLKLASALRAVHAQGLVHRDLKPGNVLLRASDGEPLLADFGLVRGLDGAELTRTGALVGTPSYWSPEQAEGRKEIDARTDVYALGATLYAALTGVPPFLPKNLLEAIRMTTEQAPDRPSRVRPGVGGALDAVVLRCLAKRPEDRYPTAAALEAALQTAVGGGGRSGRLLGPLIVIGLLVLGGLFALAAARAPRSEAVTVAVEPPSATPAPEAPSPLEEARAHLRTLSERPSDPALRRWWDRHADLAKRVERHEVDFLQLDAATLAELGSRLIEEARGLRVTGPVAVAARWRTQISLARAAAVLHLTHGQNRVDAFGDVLARAQRLNDFGPGADAIAIVRFWTALKSNRPRSGPLPARAPEEPLLELLHAHARACAFALGGEGQVEAWNAVLEALKRVSRTPMIQELGRRIVSEYSDWLLAAAGVDLAEGRAPDAALTVKIARRAFELDVPRRAYSMVRLACAQVLAGRLTVARQLAAEVLRALDPDDPGAIAVLARYDESKNRSDRAVKRLTRALATRKKGGDLLKAALARARLVQGDPRWATGLDRLDERTFHYVPWLRPAALRRLARERGR